MRIATAPIRAPRSGIVSVSGGNLSDTCSPAGCPTGNTSDGSRQFHTGGPRPGEGPCGSRPAKSRDQVPSRPGTTEELPGPCRRGAGPSSDLRPSAHPRTACRRIASARRSNALRYVTDDRVQKRYVLNQRSVGTGMAHPDERSPRLQWRTSVPAASTNVGTPHGQCSATRRVGGRSRWCTGHRRVIRPPAICVWHRHAAHDASELC